MRTVWLYYGGFWHPQTCDNQKTCAKTWEVTEAFPVTYTYFGKVTGNSPIDLLPENVNTTPLYVNVFFYP